MSQYIKIYNEIFHIYIYIDFSYIFKNNCILQNTYKYFYLSSIIIFIFFKKLKAWSIFSYYYKNYFLYILLLPIINFFQWQPLAYAHAILNKCHGFPFQFVVSSMKHVAFIFSIMSTIRTYKIRNSIIWWKLCVEGLIKHN